MIPQRSYVPADSIYPHQGLNTLDPSTLSDPRFSPRALNVAFTKGLVSKRLGYRAFGEALDGTVMALIEFEAVDGTRYFVAVTTTKQYVWNTTTDEWDNITYQEEAADVDWTGDEDDTVQWTIGTGVEGTYLIITNGVDPPRQWDGTTALFEILPVDIPNFDTCRTVAMFYDHLVLGNVTTSTSEPKALAWSDTGTLTDFTTGSSGTVTLPDSRGHILRLIPLGDRLAIYSEDSIGMVTFLGGATLFSFEQLVQGTGLLGPGFVTSIGPYHLFGSKENIYLFDGSRMIRTLGDAIARTFREEIDLTRSLEAQAFHDFNRSQVFWTVPLRAGADVLATYVLEYDIFNLGNVRWARFEYDNPARVFGETVSVRDSLRYDSPELDDTPYTSIPLRWNQGSVRAGFTIRALASGGQVYLDDEISTSDGDVAIEATWESVDFAVPQTYQSLRGRWIELELELAGREVEVSYSTDGGVSFVVIDAALVLETDFATYKLVFDVVSRTLRVRLRNVSVDGGFSLRWLRLWTRNAGA